MEQTIIKVPGMFQADEYNTPLAKTSDIKDDTQNRYQNEVNSDLYQELTKKVDKSQIGTEGGIALLDENGKIPSSQLPEYVVTEYATESEIRELFSVSQQ